MTASHRARALLRATAALVGVVGGVAVAWLAPGMFTEADGDTAGVWARWTTVAAVLALLGVAAANLVGLRDRQRMRSLALLACLGAVAVLLVLVVGGFLLSVDGPSSVVGVGMLLALFPLAAVGLALQTRHLDGPPYEP